MSETPVRIKVRCFSHLKDKLGRDSFELTLGPPATVGQAAERIVTMGGEALTGLPFRVALNKQFADDSQPLAEGDEIALIPPVQGG